MRFVKALGIYAAADFLCLFIGFTLAVSPGIVLATVSTVCTVGIMLVMLISFAAKAAKEEMRGERLSGEKCFVRAFAAYSAGASLIPAVSWTSLMASAGGRFDFYRWHKVLNGAFLRIFNVIEPSASSADISAGEAALMLPFVFVPAVTVLVTGALARRESLSEGKK